jgi:hypothetical protein
MLPITFTGAAIALLIAESLVAQSSIDYKRFLVPVATPSAVAGAYGSMWETRLSVTNSADHPVSIVGYAPSPSGCGIATCPPLEPVAPTPAGTSFVPFRVTVYATPAQFFGVDRNNAGQVHFQLHVHDLSREADDWGTEMPVVEENQFTSSELEMLSVPADTRFRSLLRIYSLRPRSETVQVQLWSYPSDQRSPIELTRAPVTDTLVTTLEVSVQPVLSNDAVYPNVFDHGYAEVPIAVAVLPNRFLRVRVHPQKNDAQIWAFVAVTNNATQHVTTMVPN